MEAMISPLRALGQNIRKTLEMVKFSHSVFALPFALSSLFFATGGHPPLRLLLLVVLCMVFARNVAMAFNRYVDAKIDGANPRTSGRHLPAGLLSKRFVLVFIIVNALLFLAATLLINKLCFILSPVALFLICFYSLSKRFTHLTQVFLGISLGIAPIAAWIAARATIQLFPVLLGLGVLFWVAGFDLIYATQDYAFDRVAKIKSLVVKWGIPKSLLASRIFHGVSLACFAFAGMSLNLGAPYFACILMMSLLMAYEHSLVKATDLSRVNAAFFNVNGVIGFIYLLGCFLELMLQS